MSRKASARQTLWQLAVATTAEAEDAVVEMLAGITSQSPVTWQDFESSARRVTAYLSGSSVTLRAMRARAIAGLRQIRACGLHTGPARVRVARVRRENWADSWKRHFKPIEFGDALLVKPGWSRRRPRKGQAQVVLDPGLSFGTGQHPTTAFCLEQLTVWRDSRLRQSFLDLGTGSGILAIAAAKLGYQPVLGLELDPVAVGIARANASRNRVVDGVRFAVRDIRKLGHNPARKWSLICANLTADLLMEASDAIAAHLADCGLLVLAGILKSEFRSVKRCWQSKGFQLLATRTEKEWQSGGFRRTL